METMYVILIFTAGLVFGSFYNVVGLRIPKKMSVVFPSSHCWACKTNLEIIDLIPVVSYIIHRGKARCCRSTISPTYPIIEFTTAVLFTLTPLLIGWSKELIFPLLLISLLIIITVSDIHYQIIPDKVLLFFLPLFIILKIWIPSDPWWDPIAGMLLGFSLLYLIAVLSKGGMGGGDIKLYTVLGIILGWKGVLLSFFLASLFGGLFGAIGLVLGKYKRRQAIPFGPFIAMGTLIAYFFADELINWYLQTFIFVFN